MKNFSFIFIFSIYRISPTIDPLSRVPKWWLVSGQEESVVVTDQADSLAY